MSETIDFDALWDMSDAQFNQSVERRPDGLGDQVGAGVDLGQALLYRGGQSLAEAFGFADSAFGQAMVDGKNENMRDVESVTAHPLYEDGEFSFRGLLDQLARGTGTMGVVLPSLAAAVPSVVVGAKGSAGALIAGGVTSGLMNVGDIGLKAEDMDESYTASFADIGTGFALGALEPFAASKFIKAMTPALKQITPDVQKALNAGSRKDSANYIRGRVGEGISTGRIVGTAVVSSAATEAVQDFTTTLKASNATNYWDELDIEEAMKESAVEGLIGGILGLPFGVGSSVMNKARNNADLSMAKQIDEGILEWDAKDGYWKKNYEKIPVTETKSAHLYNRLLAPVLGDKPAQFVGRINTPKARALAAKFNQTTGDFGRRIGVVPVHFNAMQYKTTYNKGVRDFMELSKEEAQAVHDHRVMPEDSKEAKDLKNEAYATLNEQQKKASNQLATFLDLTIKNDLKTLGIDATLFEGGTYFPLLGRLDYKKIKTNRTEFINEAVAVAEAKGLELTRDKIEAYVGRIEEQGFEHFGNETDIKVANTFKTDVDAKAKEIQEKEGLSKKKAYDKAMKIVAKGMEGRVGRGGLTSGAKVNKQNAVETHRMLAELPQDFWSNWLDPKTSVQEAVFSYYDMMSERLGHAKTFGSEGELFYKELYEVIEDAQNQGKRFDAEAALREMADAMNLSQRIPKRNLDTSKGDGLRTAQNAIRAGLSATLLPLSLLPSLAEVFVVGSRTGQTGKAIALAGKISAKIVKQQFKHGFGLSMQEASNLLEQDIISDLGISLYELKNTASARMGDNEIGGRISNFENFFYNMTGTPQWTEALRMTAAILGEQAFRSDLELYTEARNTGNIEEQIRISDKFAQAGLDVNEAYNWHLRGGKKDSYYRNQFKMGVLNIVEDTVMRPRMVQKPAWMSDERFKLIGQLKSFAVVFNNVVMKGWYNQMVANGTTEDKLRQAAVIAPYIGMMLATQIMASALREFAKTGDIEKWEDREAIDHILSAVTYIGGLSFAVDPLRASNWGVDPTTVLLGPAASKFNDTMSGLNGILSGSIEPEDVINEFLKSIGSSFPLIPALLEE